MKKIRLAICSRPSLSKLPSDETFAYLGSWHGDYETIHETGGPNLEQLKIPRLSTDDYIKQHEYLNRVYLNLLQEISTRLREKKNIDLSDNQAEMIIGPWLRLYLEAIFIRWNIVERAEESVSYFLLEKNFDESNLWPPLDRNDFAQRVAKSRGWNQLIIREIVKTVAPNKIIYIEGGSNDIPLRKDYRGQSGARTFLRSFAVRLIHNASVILHRKNCIIICSPYISIKDMLFICMRLRLWPVFYYSNHYKPCEHLQSRAWLDFSPEHSDAFTDFAVSILKKEFPLAYSEGLETLLKKVDNSKLPVAPKAVYAGSATETDDFFRAYVAKVKTIGTKYIIAQHGGVYGVRHIPTRGEFYEHRVADLWISWGWDKQGFKNVIPGVKMKFPSKRLKTCYATNSAILFAIQNYESSPMKLMEGEDENLVGTCRSLLTSIESNIAKNIIIRPHPNHRNRNYVKIISEGFMTSNIGSFYTDLKRARLFVCASNETMFLEALSFNIPTIILLEDGLSFIRKDAIGYFILLKDIGVLHTSADSAGRKINEVYKNIHEWWESDKTQSAVNVFVDRYAKRTDKPLKSISDLIESFLIA